MTPAARVQAAIEVLDQILEGAPAEKALTGWARRSRFAGSKDRAAIRDHVFDALRQRNSAAHLGGGLSGRALMVGVLRAQEVDLDGLFSGAAYAPEALSTAEIAASTAPQGALPADVPEWLIAPLKDSLGATYETTLTQMRARAPVFLRVNLAQSSVADAQAALTAAGIETRPVGLVETALEVTQGARRIRQAAPYLSGAVELQDAASQAMVSALPLNKGMKVLDYCAGGGGKTLAMAGRVTGQFHAHDAAPRRMADLPERAQRAGVKVSLTYAPQKDAPYDLVLCDAPCSGSGTWRRTPDAKWRFQQDDLDALLQTQADILDKAQALVAECGVLAYATCSFLKAENQAQVAAFHQRHPGWETEWVRQFGFEDGGDGFFGAVLRKK
ncbi:RsmB/NOP family class I SAM-dependent RNA methyltransferase [Shimia sp. R10_1]|uniref:RsmB/NOP family class I SAM-dependent RNA methyltransferase n=1 Tax=Shimia sp. R10_1 TaxID=2821095 RepID=UPI001AD9A865|nr:RsmB/NOP family class I SAM-dependent RNA methyltransferase [Shimia sp. R10_1]MBO9472097.1 RsmB/NOP family class I SAM-dependent RNA methyltransferase [Shimia sp. R10_1]